MTVEEMARIIEAESSVLPQQARLGVAQCIIDNNFNAKAFTTPSPTYSKESFEAAKQALSGKRRFPGYKLLQFRSAKYSDANGNPDWAKVYAPPSNMPRDYIYLGKDESADGKYCHHYWGTKADIPNYSLKLRCEYRGKDGLNLRSTPEFTNNIVGVVYYGDAYYNVTELSPDRKFAHLKSGVWITADPKYVRLYEGDIVDYYVKVIIYDLNIRKGSGTDYANYSEPIAPGVYNVVEEKYGLGASKWLLLKSYMDRRDGWISADFCERVTV